MRWALIGWMFAIRAIACLARVNISIAGHSIQQELAWLFVDPERAAQKTSVNAK